jgi:hypothetical protein
MPKIGFDARHDFDEALAFYEKQFGANRFQDAEGDGDADNNAGDNAAGDDGNDVSRASQTSFFGQAANMDQRALPASQKQDKEAFKVKLTQYERKLREEETQAQRYIAGRMGEIVEYGNDIQLLHVDSGKYLQATKSCADEDNSCNKVELADSGSPNVYFRVLGGFRYK